MSDLDSVRTGRLRFVERVPSDGTGRKLRILQEQWATVTWPNEPYREKGEEHVTFSWRDVPTEVET